MSEHLFRGQGIFRPLSAAKPEIVRVPSLRNVATTPPYFHDGKNPTTRKRPSQDGRGALDLTLSDQEVDSIVAFLPT